MTDPLKFNLYLEWSAASLFARGKNPNGQSRQLHLLLIDVDQNELPEVTQHRQVVSIDVPRADLANKLIAPLARLDKNDERVLATTRNLQEKAQTERGAWAESKWEQVRDSIADGRAVLPEQDLRWVTAERLDDLLHHLRTFFAHPTLVRQVAQYLAVDHPSSAAELVDLVGPDDLPLPSRCRAGRGGSTGGQKRLAPPRPHQLRVQRHRTGAFRPSRVDRPLRRGGRRQAQDRSVAPRRPRRRAGGHRHGGGGQETTRSARSSSMRWLWGA